MKIVVAEDEIILAKTLEEKLKLEGYKVFVATDGRSALDLIEKEKPDLIMTDIMMPYTSGLELISIVKSGFAKKTPIIVLSSMGEENIVLQAFELGADDFITKPFNPTELSLRVKRFTLKKK
ncbi:MAG: response regulator transcription factor [Bacteroidia bacterium]|nr:response regulator transcription factor [Bacteroidia bacterium]MCZ2298789.1 response regulator transcription factor [Chitinophagales bacterium]